MRRHLLLPLITLPLLLAACGSTVPALPSSPASSNPTTAPASAVLTPIGFVTLTSSGVTSAQSVTAIAGNNVILTRLATRVTDTATERVISADYQVRNTTSGSLSNVTLIPTSTTSTLAGTPFTRPVRADGSPIPASIAQQARPDHGTTDTGAFNPDKASFQAYSEDDVASINSVKGVSSAFPYGFVVRSATGSPTLKRNSTDGRVTVTYRFPLQSSASDNPTDFSFSAMVTTDSVTHITRGSSETGTSGVEARVQALRTAGITGPILVTLVGPDHNTAACGDCASVRLDNVRTAGTATNPLAQLIVNHTPTSSGLADMQATAGTTTDALDLSTAFSDPDGDALTYTATSSTPAVLTTRVTDHSLTLTPLTAGTATVTVTADDGRGLTTTASFKVTVARANHAPTSGGLSNRGVTLGTPNTVDLASAFSDSDGDALTFVVNSSNPTIVATSVTDHTLTLTPAALGTATVTVTADDAHGGTKSVTFTVTVNPANRAPISTGLPNITGTAGAGLTPINLTSAFSDPDGDALTYTAVSSNPGVASTSVSGATLTVTPLAAGNSTLTVTANDGHGGTQATTFSVTVTPANRAPFATSSVSEQLLTPGVTNARTFNLASIFTDPDGDALTYTVASSSPLAASASVTGNTLTLTPGSGSASGTVTVTATDPRGLSATLNIPVRTAALVANGLVAISTKAGVQSVSYDLSTLFPGQTAFQMYTGDANGTFNGPVPLSGTTWTTNPVSVAPDVWVIAPNGQAAVFQVTIVLQGPQQVYFSQFVEMLNGRAAVQLYAPSTSGLNYNNYNIDLYQWSTSTSSMKITNFPLLRASAPSVGTPSPFVMINTTFYDFFDICPAQYYNDDSMWFSGNPNTTTVAFVLKQGTQVIDVLGNPNSRGAILPTGGTITRKQGIRTGSQVFSLPGEWDAAPANCQTIVTHNQ